MRVVQAASLATLAGMLASPVSAKQMTEQQRLRAQAEHDRYADVQKLCPDDVSDEEKVKGCMKAHHAQLSPKCAKDFDAGIKV